MTCSVTAFGTQSDDARALPGYDFLAQAMGGLMSVTGEADGRPLKTGAAVVDLVCGLLAAIGIQAALAERERTGRGRHVEVSLMDAALTSLLNQGSAWVLGGVVPHRRGNRHPSIVAVRDLRDRRPPDRARGRQRPPVRAACARRSACRSCRGDERFATNSARVAHADELAELLEARAAHAAGRRVVRRAARRRRAGRARSTTSPRRSRSPSRSAWSRSPRPAATRCRRRRCGSTASARRSGCPPPRLDEHGAELREWLLDG